jgi:hypothetical protein
MRIAVKEGDIEAIDLKIVHISKNIHFNSPGTSETNTISLPEDVDSFDSNSTHSQSTLPVRDNVEFSISKENIEIDVFGRIDKDLPKGFFDQYVMRLRQLL